MADNLSPEQRSHCMSRVRVRDTDIEKLVRSELHRKGLRFRKHCKHLPGKPDIVFPRCKVAIFIDGDFWHGYRFPRWAAEMAPFWKTKIAGNRDRDQRNFRKLREMDWKVLRLWQHEVEQDLQKCVNRILAVLLEGDPNTANR